MAQIMWVVVGEHVCEHRKETAHLLEERVYADDVVPGPGVAYQARARKCEFCIDCNLAGYSCRWAWTNPDVDPFAP